MSKKYAGSSIKNASYNSVASRKNGNAKSPTWFSKNWKWLIGGILFLTGITGLSDTEEPSIGLAITLILVGIGLVAWEILILRSKYKKAKEMEAIAEEEQRIKEMEEEKARKEYEHRPRICAHCGATTTGPIRCEYCDSPLE